MLLIVRKIQYICVVSIAVIPQSLTTILSVKLFFLLFGQLSEFQIEVNYIEIILFLDSELLPS